jgi:hypothetical protein
MVDRPESGVCSIAALWLCLPRTYMPMQVLALVFEETIAAIFVMRTNVTFSDGFPDDAPLIARSGDQKLKVLIHLS